MSSAVRAERLKALPPRGLVPRQTQMALAESAGALPIGGGTASDTKGGRDISIDDAYTGGPASTAAANASASEGSPDGHSRNAGQTNG